MNEALNCLTNTEEQAIAILEEANNCGPSRYEQLVPDIYDIYRQFRIDPQTTSPDMALRHLRANL